jgi:hypothetical protein
VTTKRTEVLKTPSGRTLTEEEVAEAVEAGRLRFLERSAATKRVSLVKWGRSVEGTVASKCGRFLVEPLFLGRTTAQAYKLNGEGCYSTQRQAKEQTEHLTTTEEG